MLNQPETHSRFTPVEGELIHFLEAGDGPVVVFLHGNPTSSVIWREVILQLSHCCRCIAPDLIGMGKSSKPGIAYSFSDHAKFLHAYLHALDLNDIVFVAHDWGVALALDVMAQMPQRVRGIAFMEGRVRPLPDWSGFDEGGRELFQKFRRDPDGTRLIIEENMLIETILQAGTMRRLTDQEMSVYRAPYLKPEDRRPLLQWTREIPIANAPASTAERLERGYEALKSSPIPKLALTAKPGAVIDNAEVDLWRREITNLSVVHVGPGLHFLPLDRPSEIAAAVLKWMRHHEIV